MKTLKNSRTILRSCVMLGAVWLSFALLPVSIHAAPATSPPRVLILDETVTGGASSQEAAAAALAIPGCAVDIVPAALWTAIPASGSTGPTGYGFDQYRAIIIGDPKCQNGPGYVAGLTALNASKATWTPVCTGNAIIEGVDNAWHALGSSFPSAMAGADKTIKRGIAFAVDDATKTGFYYAMSCFYQTTPTATPVPHLAGFGLFKVRGYGGVCFDDAHIVASHPVLIAAPPLTDAELSNWGCSTHEGFDVWPPSFTVLAIALTNGAYTATDGSNGIPYILARGQGLTPIGPITLGPPIATNNLGTTHTVCAAISTNVVPNAGVAITFTISSGPNAVTNYTTLSDSNGIACFTYTGKGGLGTDYLTASYTNAAGRVFSSSTVSKIWVSACVDVGCPVVQCLSGGTWSYSFCVTNIGATPLNFVSLFNPPPGVSFMPALVTLSPPLGSSQSRTVSVIIHGPASLSSLCFKMGAHTSDEVTPACSIPVCIDLPICCNRVVTNILTFVSTVGSVSTYNYSITLQNVTGSPLKFVGFGADQPCVTFIPPMLDLTLPAYGGGLLLPGMTRTLNVQVKRTAPCPGTNEFYLSTLDTNLVSCCSTKLALPPARCVTITLPVNQAYFVKDGSVTFHATPNGPCTLTAVRFFDGTTDLGPATINTGGVYALTLPGGFTTGTHSISAVAQLSAPVGNGLGEIETSEPVEIIVVDPFVPPDQDEHDHDHGP